MARLTNLDQRNRQGNFIAGPLTVPSGTGRVRATAIIDPADYINPLTSITFGMDCFIDGAWRHVVSGKWKGGSYVDEDGNINPNPTVEVDMTAYVGQQIRMNVTVPVRISCGFELDSVV